MTVDILDEDYDPDYNIEERKEFALLARRNIRFLTGRNESSIEKALVDHCYDLPVTGNKLVGPVNQGVVNVAMRVANEMIDLSVVAQTPSDHRDPFARVLGGAIH